MNNRRFVNQVVVGMVLAILACATQAKGEVGLIGTSADPAVWKSTAGEPGPGWNTDLDFDDSQWGVPVELITWGGETSEFAVPVWDHAPVSCSPASRFTWLRAKFTLDSIPENAVLHAHADDDCEIYINGELVVNDHTCNANNIEVADVSAVLVVGTNLIAIEADDCFGGCHGIIAWIVAEGGSQAGTIYVDDDNCPGPGSGTPADPYCSIQTAIDNAVDTDEIVVAPGTYYEMIDFLGKAVTLRSSDGPTVTTIDAQESGSVITCDSGEASDTALDGFTVTGGTGTLFEPSPGIFIFVGGGIRNWYSSPTVTNCTFSGNRADRGGGIFNDHASPTVTDCTFSDNEAWNGVGGGMYSIFGSPAVTDCTFSENSAGSGGGMGNNRGNPTVTNCTFSDNVTVDYGGGMWNLLTSLTVVNCTFIGNIAEERGGGMHNDTTSTTVTNCVFIGNSAQLGGGMWNAFGGPNVVNCTFSGNSATQQGGAMRNSNGIPTVTNCILWGDTPQEISGPATVTYSDVQGGYPGTGNIDADPMCIDSISGDFHLLWRSPCIDAGDNIAVPEGIFTDLDGNPRFVDGARLIRFAPGPIVDMGAYECQFD